MDIGLVASIAMLIVWGIGALVLDAPGWIHLLLTVGMFLLIWRIAVMTGTPHHTPQSDGPADPGAR